MSVVGVRETTVSGTTGSDAPRTRDLSVLGSWFYRLRSTLLRPRVESPEPLSRVLLYTTQVQLTGPNRSLHPSGASRTGAGAGGGGRRGTPTRRLETRLSSSLKVWEVPGLPAGALSQRPG